MVSICTKMVLVLATAALLGFSLTAGGCDSGPGPEDVVREALAEMEDMNAGEMAVYFTEDTREELMQSVSMFFATMDEMEIYNLDTAVVSQP